MIVAMSAWGALDTPKRNTRTALFRVDAESSKSLFSWQDVFKYGKQPSLRVKKILFDDFIAGPESGLASPQTGWKGRCPHDP